MQDRKRDHNNDGDDDGNGRPVDMPLGSGVVLHGSLKVFDDSKSRAVVLFAHGSGSGRYSPRNRYVASALNKAGIGTLLFDLLTDEEEIVDEQTRHHRLDIGLLADRLVRVTDWLLIQSQKEDPPAGLKIGYFGASTGAAAALVAAAERPGVVRAVVSRGGRPDLATTKSLAKVRAPVLLIVGQNDKAVIKLNQEAFDKLRLLGNDEKELVIIPGATHLFEEPGKLEQVAQLAASWFARFLGGSGGIKEENHGAGAKKSAAC
ncbi:dienelactone hydrolase family protein [Nitrososphaera viennensis]|nr:alpha/beta family hydrolase [Nitrososphaera viennensis]UVS68192.1 dienelactone hydrolase family protein [Nitrososphaera viennensis]